MPVGGRKGCAGADDEDWILKKHSATRWFYVDRISGRMSWAKPQPEQLGSRTRTRQILETICAGETLSQIILEAIRLVQQETVHAVPLFCHFLSRPDNLLVQTQALYLGLCAWAVMVGTVHMLLGLAPRCTTLWVCWVAFLALDGIWPPSSPLFMWPQWLVHYGSTALSTNQS